MHLFIGEPFEPENGLIPEMSLLPEMGWQYGGGIKNGKKLNVERKIYPGYATR